MGKNDGNHLIDGASQVQKSKGGAHTAGEEPTWLPHPGFISPRCFLDSVLVPGRQNSSGFTPLCTSAHPSNLFTTSRGWLLSAEVRWEGKERGATSLCSPQSCLISNTVWLTWFNTSQETATTACDSTGMRHSFLAHFSQFDILTWLFYFHPLSPSPIPITVARTFQHSSGHNCLVLKPFVAPTVCDLQSYFLSSAFKFQERWVSLIL